MYAFVYFEIDSVLYRHKIPARAAITESLSASYTDTLKSQFKSMEYNEHFRMLMHRIQEYGQMFRARKEKSDMVEILHSYLIQASLRGAYLVGDDSPIVLVDVFSEIESQTELTQFYVSMLAPFIEVIVEKNK